jgi:hypothetical protein
MRAQSLKLTGKSKITNTHEKERSSKDIIETLGRKLRSTNINNKLVEKKAETTNTGILKNDYWA